MGTLIQHISDDDSDYIKLGEDEKGKYYNVYYNTEE